jgi:hypothetical protein
MPIKLGPSQVVKDRTTGKSTTKHSYMKSTPLKGLLDVYTRSSTTPKLRQKVRNELVRRKVEIPALEL